MQQWNRMQNSDDKIFFIDEKLTALGVGGLPLYSRAQERITRMIFMWTICYPVSWDHSAERVYMMNQADKPTVNRYADREWVFVLITKCKTK